MRRSTLDLCFDGQRSSTATLPTIENPGASRVDGVKPAVGVDLEHGNNSSTTTSQTSKAIPRRARNDGS